MMTARCHILMTLLLCLPCGQAAARDLRAGAVSFTGETRFNARQLARAARWRWPAGRFDRDSLKQGLVRLADFYARQGFNDAGAEYLLAEDSAAGRCDIRVYISEGPQYIVSSVSVTGNRRLPGAQLLSALSSRPGRPYDIAAAGADDFQLMMLYADHGMIFAEAEHQADIGEDQRVAVTFRVSEGEPVTIGRINVFGNRSVRSPAVLRELTASPGALFSRRELARSQSQLEATGLFRDISVSPGALSADHAAIDLDVTLAERPRHSVETGFGYGSGDAVRITAAWTDRNLDGWGKRLEISGQLAFQLWTRFKLVRGTMQASYLDPWLLGKRRPASANVYYDDVRPAYTDYRLQTIGGSLRTNIYNGSYINAGTAWKQEWLRLSPNWSIPGNAADTLHYRGRRSLSLYAGLERTLDPVSPIRGLRGDGGAEYTGGLLGGTDTYQRLSGTAIVYGDLRPLPLQFGARLRCGIIGDWSRRHQVPVYEKFFLGGPATLRGFGLGMAGPLDGQGRPTGGDKMVLVNLEARLRVYGKWRLACFGDAGFVSDRRFAKVSLAEAVGSPGLGVRYVLPLGSARLDAAAPLSRSRSIRAWRVIVAWGEVF